MNAYIYSNREYGTLWMIPCARYSAMGFMDIIPFNIYKDI